MWFITGYFPAIFMTIQTFTEVKAKVVAPFLRVHLVSLVGDPQCAINIVCILSKGLGNGFGHESSVIEPLDGRPILLI